MSITLLRADGTEKDFGMDQSQLTLEWMQKQVNGLIEVVVLNDELGELVVNEEGKLKHLPDNDNATALFFKAHPERSDDYIVGDVLHLTPPHRVK